MKQERLQNTCNWSSSRYSTFLECQKKYWYTYYGSWDGWPLYYNDPRGSKLDPLAAYLYMLKNMQPMAVYLGSVVHKTIEKVLRSLEKISDKKLPPKKAIINDGVEQFQKGLEESQKGLWKKHPKKHANLFEHYYHTALSQETVDAAKNKVEACLDNWAESAPVQNVIMSPRAAWGEIEKSITFPVDEETQAIVVFDFYLRWHRKGDDKEPILMIFDWKTGQESQKIEDQLYAYALAAQKTLQASYKSMLLIPFYVAAGPDSYKKIGTDQIEQIHEERIAQIETKIIQSSAAMRALHLVSIDEQGASTKPDPKLFAYTEKRSACSRCPFVRMCEKVDYRAAAIEELRQAAPPLSAW